MRAHVTSTRLLVNETANKLKFKYDFKSRSINYDESIWGVDATNSAATRRIGAIHSDTIWKVDPTNSVDNETTRNKGSTSRKTNLVSDLTS